MFMCDRTVLRRNPEYCTQEEKTILRAKIFSEDIHSEHNAHA